MADDYSNPLPPPSKPKNSAPDLQPRTNADFRKLLETPRPNATPRGFGGAGEKPSVGGEPKKAKKKPFRPKPIKEEEEEDDGPKYRDRAEERRKGVNPDYERVNAGLGGALDEDEGGMMMQPGLTVEETKYLGGDVEHTHLVKGLDYALLQKVRGELTAEELQEQQEAKARAKAAKKEEVKFVTPLGKAVWGAIFAPPRTDVRSMFLPKRMAFVYEMEPDGAASDIPTTLRRSKEDCPKPPDTMMGKLDGAVLERLAKIMSYMSAATAKPGRRLKRKDKLRMLQGAPGGAALNSALKPASHAALGNGTADTAAAAAPAKPADEDEDIFGDAGKDYVLELPQDRAKAAAVAAAKPSTSYFERKDDLSDLPGLPTTDAAGAKADGVETDMPAAPLPPPPPPPPPADAAPGPAPPPPDYDASQAYASAYSQQQWEGQGYPDASHFGDAAAYEAYVAAGVAYQAAQDPAYQALLARQQAFGQPDDAGPAALLEEGGLTQGDKDAGLGSVFKRDDERLSRMREKDEREKDPTFVPDAYGECYPGFHEFGNTVVDSDDEDLQAMDSKDLKGKSRYDFDTEETWEAYKANKESLPKAAFQFGLKSADGRKTHKDLSKDGGKNRESKINTELHKIKGILDKKGGDHSTAFLAPVREESVAEGARSKKRRI